MIIFGWGNRFTKDFGPTLIDKCEICSHKNHFNLIRTRDWFDLFFIPIFPYSTNYFLLCPNCQNGIELEDYNQIKLLKELAKKISDFDEGTLTQKQLEKEYNRIFKEISKV